MRSHSAAFALQLCAAIVSIASAAAAQNPAKRFLVGVVTDSLANPIVLATVQLNRASKVLTDTAGAFRLDAPSRGAFTIDVRRIGYRPFHAEYAAVPNTTVHIELGLVVQVLAPVQIASHGISSLETHGFYARMAARQRGTLNGYFITPEDIELRQPTLASQMLWDIPGVRVERVQNAPPLYTAFGPDGCLATTYVNGMRMNLLNKTGLAQAMSAVFDEIAPIAQLAGMEVYTRGTRAPSPYQSLNGSCAVVLIWTK